MATILELESQIHALEKQVIQLKLRRNALVPLLRLPIEIHLRIFKMLQEDEDVYDQADSSLKIKALSSTCYQLREVALRAPNMWATMNCRRGEWAELSAIRAKTVPLHLFIKAEKADEDDDERSDSEDDSEYNVIDQAISKAILIAARYLKNAQSASLFIPDSYSTTYEEATQELYKTLKEPSQLLNDFTLCFSYCRPLPTPLLGGTCSSLTSLNLKSCIISDLPYLPSLSMLVCESCQFTQGFMTTSTDLCRVPNLKALTFENNRLSDQEGIKPVPEQGHSLLPLFTHLDIHDTYYTLYRLLSILPTPQHSFAIRINYVFRRRAIIDQIITNYVHRFWENCSALHGSSSMHLHACVYPSSWNWSLSFDPSGTSGQDRQGGHRCEAKIGKGSLYFFQDILPRVQKARIQAGQVEGDWERVDSPYGQKQPLLVGLKEIEVCKLAREPTMHYLLMWLRHRKESGYPIDRVVFVDGYQPLQQKPKANEISSEVEEVVWTRSSAVDTK